MAGRKEKHTIDYFPHYVKHGKTINILEQKYGNDGYSFWFKLLEILGETQYHIYNLNELEDKIYFFSKCNIDEEKGSKILDLLARLKAIDFELYEQGYIYSQNFCDGIKDAYRNRKTKILERNELIKLFNISNIRNTKKSIRNTKKSIRNTQRREKKRKEEKRREKKNTPKKKIFGEYKNVRFTKKQYNNLLHEWGTEKLEHMIKILDEGIEMKKDKYKYTDFNLAIRKWAKGEKYIPNITYNEEKDETSYEA